MHDVRPAMFFSTVFCCSMMLGYFGTPFLAASRPETAMRLMMRTGKEHAGVQALEWFRYDAEKGCAEAQYILGLMRESG